MNKARRARIRVTIVSLQEAATEIEAVSEDETEARENLPESLQDGERGQRMEEAADELADIASEIEDLIHRLEEAIQ